MKRTVLSLLGMGIVIGALGVIGVQYARADGVPSTGALTYAGVLEDANGIPLTGSKNIQVTVWTAATAGTKACEIGPESKSLLAGAFQITLPDTCVAQVHAHADLWLEVIVDGQSLGRTKMGAVPYALEAEKAEAAATADTARSATGALETRITAIESTQAQAPTVLEQSSNTRQDGTNASNVVYTNVGLTLEPGVWLVHAYATLYTTGAADAVQLGLYDATHSADVADSRGPLAVSNPTGTAMAMTTSKVVTLTSASTLRMKGYRNGNSTLHFGCDPSASCYLPSSQRLLAVRLH